MHSENSVEDLDTNSVNPYTLEVAVGICDHHVHVVLGFFSHIPRQPFEPTRMMQDEDTGEIWREIGEVTWSKN